MFPRHRTNPSKLMEEMVDAGILTPEKDGPEVFCFDDLIRILAAKIMGIKCII
jgi:hypothetical protein